MNERDITANYHGGEENSEEAHSSTTPESRERQRQKVLNAIKLAGDATCDQIEDILGMPHQSCSARFTELKKAGLIVKTGDKRKTRMGRSAAVYRPADDFNFEEAGQSTLF